MPELPEVETIRASLARLIAGRKITGSRVYDSPKSFPNDPHAVKLFLHGAVVTAVQRRAKVLLIRLDTNYTLVIHLKMTGQIIVRGTRKQGSSVNSRAPGETAPNLAKKIIQAPEPLEAADFAGGHPNDSLIGELPDRSTRVQLDFADGARLFFNDQRKFGWMKLYPTPEVESIPFMQKVGPEPFDLRTTAQDFIARIRRHNNTTLKAAILNQATLAGVGNIYADEALWLARLHPATRVHAATDEQLAELFRSIRQVLQFGIDKGGSTDRNYVDAEGNRGNYLEYANVFRREGQPCRRHADAVIEKIRVAGRGTHICPACQVVQ